MPRASTKKLALLLVAASLALAAITALSLGRAPVKSTLLSLEASYKPHLHGTRLSFTLKVRVVDAEDRTVKEAKVLLDGREACVDGVEAPLEVSAGVHEVTVYVGGFMLKGRLPIYFPSKYPQINSSLFFKPKIPVVAAYYAMYGNHHSEWRHWGDPQSPSISFSPFLGQVSGDAVDQAFGLYGFNGREENLKLIMRQMALARMSGVTAFAVSWWGPGSSGDQHLHEILEAAEVVGMNITVIFEPFHGFDEEAMKAAADYLKSKYMNSSVWLKDRDGQPVIFTFNLGPPSNWTKWTFIKERNEAWVAHTTDRRALSYGFKYIYEYAPAAIKIHGYNITAVYDAASAGGRFIPTLSPRYNDTRFRSRGHAFNDLWEETSKATRFVLKERDPPFIFVTSWNEWNEGTSVEPSLDKGFTYLFKLRAFLGGEGLSEGDFLRVLHLDEPPSITLTIPLS